MSIDTIMALVDPTLAQQVAFERAFQLARGTGAALHIYACADLPAGSSSSDPDPATLASLEQLSAELVSQAREKGVRVSSEIEARVDWRGAAVAAAARCSANLLVKYSFDHSDIQRQLRITSDWELLRNSPCPVLLTKNYTRWQHDRILAAININAADGAHVWLNNQIISVARGLAEATNSELHFVNAHSGSHNRPNAEELASRCGVPLAQVHVQLGVAADVISDMVEGMEVDLVVLGTVGRSGIRGKLFGNTSEKLLDNTHADLLVVN